MVSAAFAYDSGNFFSFPHVICQRPFDWGQALTQDFQTKRFDLSRMDMEVERRDSLLDDMLIVDGDLVPLSKLL